MANECLNDKNSPFRSSERTLFQLNHSLKYNKGRFIHYKYN